MTFLIRFCNVSKLWVRGYPGTMAGCNNSNGLTATGVDRLFTEACRKGAQVV